MSKKYSTTARKFALNLVRIHKDSNHKPRTSLKGIMSANIFDLAVFLDFVKFFRTDGELG
jgi:hypothetical protein